MASKGRFTQCVAVLLRRPIDQAALRSLLEPFGPVPVDDQGEERPPDWFFAATRLLIPYRPEVNGWIEVDQVDEPWPDSMGDPKDDPLLFGAWAAGCFGLCWPGSLASACAPHWLPAEIKAAPHAHRAFLRVRASYLTGLGKAPDAPLWPVDYDPAAELQFVTRVAEHLAGTSEAFAYFNPAGERILWPGELSEILENARSQGIIPIDAWAATRLFHLAPAAPDWRLMDTIGLAQLDAPDHEATYPDAGWDPNEISSFLWNTASYVVANGPIIKKGDTTNSTSGALWRAVDLGEARAGPKRRVISWRPAVEPEFESDVPTSPERSGEGLIVKWMRSIARGRKAH